MDNYIREIIDVPPLSINRAFQGRRYKTAECKKWEEMALIGMQKKEMIKGDIVVDLTFYMKYPKKCDIDNPVKLVLDILTKKGWIEDDRKISKLIVYKTQSDEPKIKVEILKT